MKLHVLLTSLLLAAAAFPASAQPSASRQLKEAAAIRALLSGKYVGYSLPGWADTDIWEGFEANGTWTGTLLGRGPVPFSGRWKIDGERICVLPDQEGSVATWFSGWRCRIVWIDENTGRLSMEYLDPRRASFGALLLEIRDFPASVQVR
ncbi:MAG: hypothetical protein ACTHNA_15120 [Sphingopyxis terrae]|uniref:hypothetical protein n=1 Tax=Sphingopyxis terrae TaxID=33052 RepID=UPI0013C3EF59|nr:hypothetical protein [Sphingopyxis terrae]